jgi:hypothetical protein
MPNPVTSVMACTSLFLASSAPTRLSLVIVGDHVAVIAGGKGVLFKRRGVNPNANRFGHNQNFFGLCIAISTQFRGRAKSANGQAINRFRRVDGMAVSNGNSGRRANFASAFEDVADLLSARPRAVTNFRWLSEEQHILDDVLLGYVPRLGPLRNCFSTSGVNT